MPVVWASLLAQMVKNLPEVRETQVQSLGWEYPLERGRATYSSILAWRILGVAELNMTERLSGSLSSIYRLKIRV